MGNRRDFIKKSALGIAGLSMPSFVSASEQNTCASSGKPGNSIQVKTPLRSAGQSDVLELRCPPIENVRVAVIGLGNRGIGAVYRTLNAH